MFLKHVWKIRMFAGANYKYYRIPDVIKTQLEEFFAETPKDTKDHYILGKLEDAKNPKIADPEELYIYRHPPVLYVEFETSKLYPFVTYFFPFCFDMNFLVGHGNQ